MDGQASDSYGRDDGKHSRTQQPRWGHQSRVRGFALSGPRKPCVDRCIRSRRPRQTSLSRLEASRLGLMAPLPMSLQRQDHNSTACGQASNGLWCIFRFEYQQVFRCPAGERLRRTGRVVNGDEKDNLIGLNRLLRSFRDRGACRVPRSPHSGLCLSVCDHMHHAWLLTSQSCVHLHPLRRYS